MAEQALGPGGRVARRRAFFGLLDANGWGWAGVKAAVWFVLIIMLMAYLPGPRALRHGPEHDRPRRLAQGVQPGPRPDPDQLLPRLEPERAVPGSRRDGPAMGAEPGRAALAGAARADAAIVGAGLQTLLVGGTDGKTAQASVFATVIRPDGNIDAWSRGRTPCRRRAPRHRPSSSPASRTSSAGSTRAARRPTPSSRARRTRRPARSRPGPKSTDLKLPAPARRGRGRGRRRWGLPHRRDRREGAGRHRLEGDARREERQAEGVGAQRAAHLVRRGRGRRSRRRASTPSPTLIGQNLFVWGGEDAAGPTTHILRGDVSVAKETLGRGDPVGEPDRCVRRAAGSPGRSPGRIRLGGQRQPLLRGRRWRQRRGDLGDPGRGRQHHGLEAPGRERSPARPRAPRLGARSSRARTSSSSAASRRATRRPGRRGRTSRRRRRSSSSASSTSWSRRWGSRARSASSSPTWSPPAWRPADFVLLLLIGYAFNHKERTRAFLQDLRNRRRRTA